MSHSNSPTEVLDQPGKTTGTMSKEEHKQDWVSCAADVALCTPDLLSSETATAIEHDAPQLQSLSNLTSGSTTPLAYTNDKHEDIGVDNDESNGKNEVNTLKEKDDNAENAPSNGGLTRHLASMQIKESCTVQVIVDSGNASSKSCCSLDDVLLTALKCPQERMFLLKLDREFCSFIENPSQTQLDLPWLNSYYRMMIHRSADYFQLARKVNTLQKKITLSKTERTAIPVLRFCDLVEVEVEEPPVMPIRVLRRYPTRPASVCGSGTSAPGPSDRRNVTIEQREKAYAEARRRIFQEDKPEIDSIVLTETDCPIQSQSQGTSVEQSAPDRSQSSTNPTTSWKEGTTVLDSLRCRSSSSSTSSSSSSSSSSSGATTTETSARPDSATNPSVFQGPDYASSSGYSPPSSRHSFASGYDHFHRQAPPAPQLGSSVGIMDHRGAAGFHCDCRHDSGHLNGASSSPSSSTSSTPGIIRQSGPRYLHHSQDMPFNPVSDPPPMYCCQVSESHCYQCPWMNGSPVHTRQFGHPHDPRNTHCGCLGQHHHQQHRPQGIPQQPQQQQSRGDMSRRLSSPHSFVPGYQQAMYHSGSHAGSPTQGSRHDRHYHGHHQHHSHHQHPHHLHHHHHYPQHHHHSSAMDTPPRCCDHYHPESRNHQDDTYSTDTTMNASSSSSSSPPSGLFQVSVRPYPSSNGYRPYRQGLLLPQLPRRQEGQSSLRQRQQHQTQFQATREQQHHHNHHHPTHPHPHPYSQSLPHQQQQLQPRSRPQQQHTHSYESRDRTSSSSSGSSSGSSVSTSVSDSSISTSSAASNANATAQQNRLSWRMRVAAMSGREESESLQQVVHNVERRPPKSTELYDPYA